METPRQSMRELAEKLSQLYTIPPTRIKNSQQFKDLIQCSGINRIFLLSSIPSLSTPSYRPLYLLFILLTELPGPWPTLALAQCHGRLVQNLPNGAAPDDGDGDSTWLVRATEDLIKQSYDSVLDFLYQDDRPALYSHTKGRYITHKALHTFVTNFSLPEGVRDDKPVVALAIPNGPLLSAVCIAVATYYTAALVDPSLCADGFKADVNQARASVIITTAEDYKRLRLGDGKQLILLATWDGTRIHIMDTGGRPAPSPGSVRPISNSADDVALVHLQGDVSDAKTVMTLTTHDILKQAVSMNSWYLQSRDVGLNMMSIHQPNIFADNILAPLWRGGAVVCCHGFDAAQFWTLLDTMMPTWYRASSAMQCAILSRSPKPAAAGGAARHRLRLVCTAGRAPSPAVERQLRDTFRCAVLPAPETTRHIPDEAARVDTSDAGADNTTSDTAPALPPTEPAKTTAGRVADRAQPVPLDYEDPGGVVNESTNGAVTQNTPDYLGEDGYLYVMGRSREAINRAGQLISPFEVEAAIISAATAKDTPISGRVCQALAFAVPHGLLQEAVAVVLVTPPGIPRADLKALHSAVRPVLTPSKWPVMIVYMEELPMQQGKVVRSNLAQRLGLPEVTDKTLYLSRHWETTSPLQCVACEIDRTAVTNSMRSIIPTGFQACLRLDPVDGSLEAFVAPKEFTPQTLTPDWAGELKKRMAISVHNYMIPNKVHLLLEPFPEDPHGTVDEDGLQELLDRVQTSPMGEKTDSETSVRVTRAFALALGCKPVKVLPDVHFLAQGGDDAAATKLLAHLRAEFGVDVPAGVVFNQGTVLAVTLHVDAATHSNTYAQVPDPAEGCAETRSSTRPLLMLLQLLPIAVFYPIRRAAQWSVFLTILSFTRFWKTNAVFHARLAYLVLAIALAYLAIQLVSPFIGIAAKWLIVGRYREGVYPMWGSYHTRWWMVQKIVSLSGAGFFNASDGMKSVYCRLMGARIGRNVVLTGAALSEWDLLDIGDGVTLDRCACRPFAVERNTSMYLGRITIGENASVGYGSYVAPGTEVPAGACIGLNSSSWEVDDADETNRELSSKRIKSPHWALTAFLTVPLYATAWFLTLAPWFAGLGGLVVEKPKDSPRPLRDILEWFPTSPTVVYHYIAMFARTIFSPYILFFFTVLVRATLDRVFGPVRASPSRTQGHFDIWRSSIVKTLLPDGRLREITEVFGQHYEFTSTAFRLLGSSVGKRVRWPWQTPSVGDYHMLHVGDDVVFGNRVQIITSDGLGRDRIAIRDRAVVADQACLLAGVDIGEETAMECGVLTTRGRAYPAHGTYIGSRRRDAVCLTSDGEDFNLKRRIRQMQSRDTLVATKVPSHLNETLVASSTASALTEKRPLKAETVAAGGDPAQADVSPYERAFHRREASYYVFGPFVIWLYSTFLSVFTVFFWNIPIICSMKIAGRVFLDHIFESSSFNPDHDPYVLFGLAAASMMILTTAFAVFAAALVIGAKWLLLGRGQPGSHDWDKTSYCQRRQVFLTIERLMHRCYREKGVVGLLSGTHWLVLYYRALGARIGNDCAIYAGGRPSLAFTEPDMVTLGDRVALDNAAILAHNDVRGKFHLDPIEIGDRCALRAGSSILSGARMRADSCLLEHTAIMSGDVVETGWTMQGWPAERFEGRRTGAGAGRAAESRRNNSDATLVGEELGD